MTFTTSSSGSDLVKNMTSGTTYSTIQVAYNYAADKDDVLRLQSIPFNESPDFNLNEVVTIEGGYDSTFSLKTGMTTVYGSMTISAGTITAGNVILH